jgi:AcrR family transcriptional regulator
MSTVSGRRADAVRNRQLALDAATALLAEPDAPLTVEAIATRAGLGVGTVVRAFGGKDALLDAAVAGLLEPVVDRGRQLLRLSGPESALRTFLAELVAFQSAHYAISEQLGGLDLPATTALRGDLVRVVQEMIRRGRADGTVRTDIDLAATSRVITETSHTIARARPRSSRLTAAFVAILLDGLRPQPSTEDGHRHRSAENSR